MSLTQCHYNGCHTCSKCHRRNCQELVRWPVLKATQWRPSTRPGRREPAQEQRQHARCCKMPRSMGSTRDALPLPQRVMMWPGRSKPAAITDTWHTRLMGPGGGPIAWKPTIWSPDCSKIAMARGPPINAPESVSTPWFPATYTPTSWAQRSARPPACPPTRSAYMSPMDHSRASSSCARCAFWCLNIAASKPVLRLTPSQWRPGRML